MESQDQVLEQSAQDQPEVGTSDEVETQSQTFDVNGQTLTGDKLLENYKKLQAEYTKSRQELSGAKQNTLSEEEKAAVDFLRNNGFATKEDLENLTNAQRKESVLNDIFSHNPDLKPFETAIRDLAKTHNAAPEDIIEKYGFKSKDKLAKAKSQGDLKGSPDKKAKSIADMSMDEYEEYRKKAGIGSGSMF